jgi:hypothetical protein
MSVPNVGRKYTTQNATENAIYLNFATFSSLDNLFSPMWY